MSSTYNGNPANISIATAFSETIPADGDGLAVASVNPPFQKIADFIESIRQGIATVGFTEGFESATFPPVATSKWTAPSTRFGSDTAWVRKTANPIAGTASASAPTPQALSTNSSLGLDTFLMSPSRLTFFWSVNSNNNNGDHLDFFVDGVLYAQLSTQVSNTLVAGMFRTDLIREGFHTFDWRFVRGGSASVAAEECQIDTIEIMPEVAWQSDPARLNFFEDGFLSGFNGVQTVNISATANSTAFAPWIFATGANVGGFFIVFGNANIAALGDIGLVTAATAIGDWASMRVQGAQVGAFSSTVSGNFAAMLSSIELRVSPGALTVNNVVETGWVDASSGANNFIGWAYDGGNGAASSLRWRLSNAGAVTSVDSGVAATANTWYRLGVHIATVRGITSAVFVKDGKALPGAASVPPVMVTGFPTLLTLSPGVKVRSVTAASATGVNVDWVRILSLRPT